MHAAHPKRFTQTATGVEPSGTRGAGSGRRRLTEVRRRSLRLAATASGRPGHTDKWSTTAIRSRRTGEFDHDAPSERRSMMAHIARCSATRSSFMVVHVGEIAEQAIRPADRGAQEASIARVSAELLETPFSRRSPGCEIGRSTACEPSLQHVA